MASEAQELLRRLTVADDCCLQSVLAPTSQFDGTPSLDGQVLDRQIRDLVRLAALLAVDASITSLRWAVELAASNGASDEALVAALAYTAGPTGTAQLVRNAPRLALALGFDLELESSDGS